MPPGAKKRKAARRKKKQAANTIGSSTNNPHGNDDPRSQDERDSVSDGGYTSSHVIQDAFSQGEDEGKRSQSRVTEEKSVEEATKDTKSTEKPGSGVVDVKIEKGWEPKSDLESTYVSIQHVEDDKSSSSSSSSNSNSDDESQAFKKKSKEEARNIGSEVASYNTGNKSATVLAEEVPKVAENGAFENGDSNSSGDTVVVDNTVKTALSMPEVSVTSEKNSVPDIVQSGLNANEEKLFPSSNGISGVEGKNSPSLDIPIAESSNVAETNQTLEPHKYSEKQPLVASTPPVKRTSCLSCCGLFEAFTGSGR